MILHILRALFVLVAVAIGWAYVGVFGIDPMTRVADPVKVMLTLSGTVTLAVLFVCIDILSPRKKLAVFSGTFLGLVVGISFAYGLSFVVQLLVDLLTPGGNPRLVQFIDLLVGISCCYLAISFILQTKDDFRFIVPYVEFSKKTKGARPILLDTSVLIDGRISDIAGTGILESQLVVPRFVLEELQGIADSSDKLKRNRGRRGLDVLGKLQNGKRVDVILYEPHGTGPESQEMDVDAQLMDLAKELNGRVLTNDYNLNKVAQLRGVDVININDLGNALKPVVLPGERMSVRLVKPGEESGQGVGYLDDGTMVVVEGGRQHVNDEVEFTVTSALQTSAGRMIFGRMSDSPGAPPHRRSRPRSDPQSTST